ncbi:MAG: PEP-CTERM sorting domain-containing protein [Planctomycetota bacterium]|nr:PEP-CTERM sorting domain-containing protein [Planctomycetota bacterium]
MKTTRLIPAALLASLALAGAAGASTIDVRFTGTQRGSNVRITSPDLTGAVFAGQLKHRLSDGPAALNGDWITFCTDLAQHVTSNTRSYEVVDVAMLPGSSPMGADAALAINDLYAFSNGAQLSTSTSNDLATAFQLAVWEIVVDFDPEAPGFNLSVFDGDFRATKSDGSNLSSGVLTHLSSLFGAIGGSHAPASLLGLRSGQHQDQLIPVPAPGATVLAGLGLVCVSARRRTR